MKGKSTVMINIYLASPFFCNETRKNVEKVAASLRKRGFSVYVPMEHKISDGENMDNKEWGKLVFKADREAINNSDAIVVMYYGMDSDSGTSWEQGYAYAKNIPIILINCQDKQKENIINIMNASSAGKVFTLEQALSNNYSFDNDLDYEVR